MTRAGQSSFYGRNKHYQMSNKIGKIATTKIKNVNQNTQQQPLIDDKKHQSAMKKRATLIQNRINSIKMEREKRIEKNRENRERQQMLAMMKKGENIQSQDRVTKFNVKIQPPINNKKTISTKQLSVHKKTTTIGVGLMNSNVKSLNNQNLNTNINLIINEENIIDNKQKNNNISLDSKPTIISNDNETNPKSIIMIHNDDGLVILPENKFRESKQQQQQPILDTNEKSCSNIIAKKSSISWLNLIKKNNETINNDNNHYQLTPPPDKLKNNKNKKQNNNSNNNNNDDDDDDDITKYIDSDDNDYYDNHHYIDNDAKGEEKENNEIEMEKKQSRDKKTTKNIPKWAQGKQFAHLIQKQFTLPSDQLNAWIGKLFPGPILPVSLDKMFNDDESVDDG